MHKILLLFLLCCSLSSFALQEQDTVAQAQESVDMDNINPEQKYEYWKKDHYKGVLRVDSLAQPSQQSFDQMVKKYQSKEFEYVESISDKLSVWQSIKKWLGNFFSDLFPDINVNPGEWFYDLLGILGAALVVFLLYKFFFSGRQFILSPKEELQDEEATIDFVERNLLDIDINTYIKDAVNSKNYALAIRYQQLLNIQLLSKKNVISWDQTKTNLQLMDEIENMEIKSDFKKCASLFDYVWFGEFNITASKFEEITNQFQDFQRRWS